MLSGISKDIDWTPFNGRRLFSPYYDASQPFLRALSYALFFGPIEGQEERLISLLEARDKLARAAGKASFLYRAVQPSSLAESPERVERFLKKVSYLLSPIATGTARSQLIKDLPNMDRLRPWDIPFLIHSGQQWIDTESLLPFFSLGACMEGVNQLSDCLFGLRLQVEPALPGEVWHPDVVKVSAYTTEAQSDPLNDNEVDPWEAKYPIGPGVQVGTIYCDFFQRPGKMSQDCHYTIRGGRHTENTMFESHSPYQFPIVVIQLNLGPSPAQKKGDTPTLLSPAQVENLFHEWGHALHSVLGRTRYQHVTGTRPHSDSRHPRSLIRRQHPQLPTLMQDKAGPRAKNF
uniref:Peptidase_M3 domain-containing protein n=1 Tax=Mesocestoides corti TaxID=53468 RepID=A0A5K3FQN0_MESCO